MHSSLGLGITFTFVSALSVGIVACSGGGGSSGYATNDGGTLSADGGNETSQGIDESESSPPHALGTVMLGEIHAAGESTSTPVLTATFVPSVKKSVSCATKLDGCTITTFPRCTETTSSTGCGTGDFCTWDDACKPTCEKVLTCTTPCEEDEVCTRDPKSKSGAGRCEKIETFDAGPLAFSGTTTALTLFPPYQFKATDDGAPFVGGDQIRVKAQGAIGAGFEKFEETFTATTFIQTTPALQKLSKEKVFGTGPLSVGWVPGEDTVVISVTSAYGAATCTAKDAAGTFDVPRSVIDAVRTSPDGKSKSGMVSTAIARERKEVKKDKKTKGKLTNVDVEAVGWLELVTSSKESASFQGCTDSAVACGNACVDVDTDSDNCGGCGIECSASQHCTAGKCVAGPVCIPGAEASLAACSDGCSNDGDAYVDCDDYDCCPFRANCPATTACGK